MIDLKAVQAELQEARRSRIKAEAAGRYLEILVRRLSGSRRPWQWVEPAMLQRFESTLAQDWPEAA